MTKIMPVILAGGAGSRLASLLSDRPKPLAPVADRPFITYLLDRLLDAGFDQAIIATGHLGEKFPEILGHSYKSLKLIYSRESEPLGTGGALRLALESAPEYSQQFLVLNGDSFVDLKITDFILWAQDFSAVMVVVRVQDASRYGSVIIAEDAQVLKFQEKSATARPAWINAGIYLLSRELLEVWPMQEPFSFENRCLPELVAASRLYAFKVTAPFIDIGIPETYLQTVSFMSGLENNL